MQPTMSSMLTDAATLMAIGMLSVFSFLVVLTLLVSALTKLAPVPASAGNDKRSSSQGTQSEAGQPNAAQMAAIATAVTQYRAAHESPARD